MQSVNLWILSQMCENEQFSAYETLYSRREQNVTPEHEQKVLASLVKYLVDSCSITYADMDNFFFSYHIPQISKEFDLLRISNCDILNIELKTSDASLEKAKNQLIRNKYYLNHLQKKVHLYTFIDTDQLFTLDDDNQFIKANPNNLKRDFDITDNCPNIDIDSLFTASKFLISPLNTPDSFLDGNYFLTSQQEEIENSLLESMLSAKSHYYGITGSPGTGKTLVLYDLSKKICRQKKCCIIHCAPLSEGHAYLNDHLNNCSIVTPKQFCSSTFPIADYNVFLFDEFHRAYDNAFAKAKLIGTNPDKFVVFSYDFGQTVAQSEERRCLEEKIKLLPGLKEYKLSTKIRTNKEMASFIQRLLTPKKYGNDKNYHYSNVKVLYSPNRSTTIEIIKLQAALGYTHINHSTSLFKPDSFDSLNTTNYNAHKVFGQEFDNVIVVLNEEFYYENGILCANSHANPDYLYVRMLYEEITRVREKLCIVVENNQELLKEIINLFPVQ